MDAGGDEYGDIYSRNVTRRKGCDDMQRNNNKQNYKIKQRQQEEKTEVKQPEQQPDERRKKVWHFVWKRKGVTKLFDLQKGKILHMRFASNIR